MADEDDWRLRDQEQYMLGEPMTLRRYRVLTAEWEHEHCEFCFESFADARYSDWARRALEVDPEVHGEGFTETGEGEQAAGEHWVCRKCFEEFREMFKWRLVESDPEAWPYARPEPTEPITIDNFDDSKAYGRRPDNAPQPVDGPRYGRPLDN